MSETTFKEAWGVLQRHAQTLRNQSEPNIDDLLAIVTESVEAYKVCTSRIDAVEQALDQALGGTGIATPAAGPESVIPRPKARPQASPPASGSDANEDDVPF